MASLKEQVEEVKTLINEVVNDLGVPRNIRRAIDEAKKKVEEKVDATNLSVAIYLLDDISNDINMPAHTRTEIWTIISKLEAIKEKVKK